MKYGSLFSGAGLGDFGFEMAGLEVAWQCEFNEYARKVLDLRWPDVKKYEDIRTIKPEELSPVDLITGGFPCQPFSVAGKQMAERDDRNLWPEMFRIIKAVKPRWVVAENVPGIIPLYLDTVLADLGSQGYTCWPIVFSSHSLGAQHLRERLWIVGHAIGPTSGSRENFGDIRDEIWKTSSDGRTGIQPQNGQACADDAQPAGEAVADPMQQGLPQRDESGSIGEATARVESGRESERGNTTPWRSYWETEPKLGRVANGIANRVDRLKCLGNGQTPCSTYVIGKWILEIEVLNKEGV